MTEFSFTILGANSATPMKNRFPSSFILRYNNQGFLIDCGEGSQIKMSEFGIRRSKIDHIFISHLHGDHIFGLPGFVNSYNLQGRTKQLTIYGPEGIKDYLTNIQRITQAYPSYDIKYCELTGDKSIDLGVIHGLRITAIPLQHRIITYGYKFEEVEVKINIDPLAIEQYSLTVNEIKTLKAGDVIVRNGKTLDSAKFILPINPKRSFAYCSDTSYFPELAEHIHGCTMIYHEATYTHDLVDKAKERSHSTAHEAALIAEAASVDKLIIGHYSSRYKDLNVLENEAKEIFPETKVAIEGQVHHI